MELFARKVLGQCLVDQNHTHNGLMGEIGIVNKKGQ